MKRHSTIALAGLLMVAGASLAGGPRNTDPGLNAYQRFQGGPAVSPIPAPKPTPDKTKAKPIERVRRSDETAAALRAQEEADLFRRLAVCDRIKQIALEQGDPKLEDEAIRLEQRAEEVYRQRTAKKASSSEKREEGRK